MEQDKILYERSTVENGEGQVFQVVETHTGLVRYTWTSARSWECYSDNVNFLEQDAIDSARAILRHFNVDFNGFEENISSRFRMPTKEEIDSFLDENPDQKIIDYKQNDPDEPLTSALSVANLRVE